MERIEVYTDGGCHGNPGPGAWACVIVTPHGSRECAGREAATTNNRMELEAVIRALRSVADTELAGRAPGADVVVTVHTDSQYVRNGITSWIRTWMRNGWMTSGRKPVKNRELWQTLHDLDELVRPGWKWVKGHSGHSWNERCDELVQAKIRSVPDPG